LEALVNKRVEVVMNDGRVIAGRLGFAESLSAQHHYRKPQWFYIGHQCFRSSHIKKVEEI